MRLRHFVAASFIAVLATAAHAGAVYGSSAVETIPVGSPDISRINGNVSDMNGKNGTGAQYRNSPSQTGAQTFSVRWDVNGAGSLIHWQLFVVGRTPNTAITQVTLTDDSGVPQTVVSTTRTDIVTGGVQPTAVTQFNLTNYHSQSDYSTNLSFNWNNIQFVEFEFELNNPVGSGRRGTVEIDAIANPEPGTLALFGLGALGLAGLVRRRRRGASGRTDSAS